MIEKQTHTPTSTKPKKSFFRISKRWFWLAIVLLIVVGVIVAITVAVTKSNKPVGQYEDANFKATASFAMDIDFKRNCAGKENCDPNKPAYDFKVFVFDAHGTQVRVVRADKDGTFKASLPEGEYILLTAKTFEGQEGMPQEMVSLKQGKVLKLHVDYGTEKP